MLHTETDQSDIEHNGNYYSLFFITNCISHCKSHLSSCSCKNALTFFFLEWPHKQQNTLYLSDEVQHNSCQHSPYMIPINFHCLHSVKHFSGIAHVYRLYKFRIPYKAKWFIEHELRVHLNFCVILCCFIQFFLFFIFFYHSSSLIG